MPPRRRQQSPPPWERAGYNSRNSGGARRRRYPRAYDGGLLDDEAVQRRYRRAYDGEPLVERRKSPRSTMDSLRQSPIKNGLIGLAVAGTAAPIAINRHQQALRTDPSHETIVAGIVSGSDASSDSSLSKVWQQMESEASTAQSSREAAITASVEKYSEFGLSRELAAEIYDVAVDSEIDPEVAFGLVRAESSFKNSSTSPVGAVGLTQLMPKTADWLEPGTTRSDLRDSETNLRIGFKYLRQLIDKYEGNENLALVAYNRGPGTVDRELKKGGNPDNGYADFVRGKADHGHSLYSR